MQGIDIIYSSFEYMNIQCCHFSVAQVLLEDNTPTDFGASVSSCNGDGNESSCIEVSTTGGALDADIKYAYLLKEFSP